MSLDFLSYLYEWYETEPTLLVHDERSVWRTGEIIIRSDKFKCSYKNLIHCYSVHHKHLKLSPGSKVGCSQLTKLAMAWSTTYNGK